MRKARMEIVPGVTPSAKKLSGSSLLPKPVHAGQRQDFSGPDHARL